MDTGFQPRLRNDFSKVGLSEIYVSENPDYINVFDFEKQDWIPVFTLLEKHFLWVYPVAGFYLVSVYILQKWMKTREAFELRKPLFIWNVLLAGLSVTMLVRILPELVHVVNKYGFYRSYCRRDHLNTASAFWSSIYVASKILEFIDTVFIILRKQKLTFLHVFHHTSVLIASVYGLLYSDYAARYFVVLNTFVHSVMYTYFALKSAQVKLPRKLSMAVTSIQLVQFSVAICINCLITYAQVTGTKPTCIRSPQISILYSSLAVGYLCLFGNFFYESYIKKKPSKTKTQ